MLSKEYRLRKDKELKAVFSSKKGIFDPACGVKLKENGLKNTRFAFVVSTKVSKNAVERNRVRRQYREIVREMLDEIAEGNDVIFLVGKLSLELSYEEKKKRIEKVLKKAKLV